MLRLRGNVDQDSAGFLGHETLSLLSPSRCQQNVSRCKALMAPSCPRAHHAALNPLHGADVRQAAQGGGTPLRSVTRQPTSPTQGSFAPLWSARRRTHSAHTCTKTAFLTHARPWPVGLAGAQPTGPSRAPASPPAAACDTSCPRQRSGLACSHAQRTGRGEGGRGRPRRGTQQVVFAFPAFRLAS